MAADVNEAFREFLSATVRTDSQQAISAEKSRAWLMGQLDGLAESDSDFPAAYKERNLFYGSFSRKTKIVEVDDIDLIFALHAQQSTYSVGTSSVEITVVNGSPLVNHCDEGTLRLNSRKVINEVVRNLKKVPQYSKAEVKRNEAAAVLSLSSYPWVFDIVPGFFTKEDLLGRTYYLIPDGAGSWMRTDPRIDQSRVDSADRDHDGNVRDLIRLAKYWNKRQTMPSISSYLMECIVLDFVEASQSKMTRWPDVHLSDLFRYIGRAVFFPVYDPKGLDGNINRLDYDDASKVSSIAARDAAKATEARRLEDAKDERGCIRKWREIFGDEFPEYSS